MLLWNVVSLPLQSWVDRIRAGEVRALARAISTIEDSRPESRDLLKALFPHTGNARVIGRTISPRRRGGAEKTKKLPESPKLPKNPN